MLYNIGKCWKLYFPIFIHYFPPIFLYVHICGFARKMHSFSLNDWMNFNVDSKHSKFLCLIIQQGVQAENSNLCNLQQTKDDVERKIRSIILYFSFLFFRRSALRWFSGFSVVVFKFFSEEIKWKISVNKSL